jgi:hypothetical protein
MVRERCFGQLMVSKAESGDESATLKAKSCSGQLMGYLANIRVIFHGGAV